MLKFLNKTVHHRYGAITLSRNLCFALFLSLFPLSISERAFGEPVTIAALGDSLVHGYGLHPEDGFVPHLQDWLQKHGVDVDVINAGVSGDTTAGGLSRVDWTLTPDVDALIISLGGNDVLRGIDPETSNANLTGILEKAAAKQIPILLIGLKAPANYGLDYQTKFDAIFPTLAEKFDTLLYPNFLGSLLIMPGRASTLKTYFQRDGLHPNAKGVAHIVQDIGPIVVELAERTKP